MGQPRILQEACQNAQEARDRTRQDSKVAALLAIKLRKTIFNP